MSSEKNLVPSSIASFCSAIARLLESYNIDPADTFNRAGINLSSINDSGARFPINQISLVWRIAVKDTGNSAIGLEIVDYIEPTSFHSLGISLWASNTLLEVLERYVRFTQIISDGMELVLHVSKDFTELQVINHAPERAHEGCDACLSSILGICRRISNIDFDPISVEMQRPKPNESDKFNAFFKSDVNFNGKANIVRFRTSDLRQPLPNANEELAKHNDMMSINYIAKYNKDRWAAKIYIQLLQLLPKGISAEVSIADALAVTQTNLRYYLRKENTNYRKILDDTRKQLAIHYLHQEQLPLTEITYLLGFSNPSNFSRAFKKWTGYTPGNYRSRH